ncbi:transmembrane protein [Ceratobasidium sp. AG-Ba]|nr:transmembrane protein [Ceratobasidium sp. AG-Ba]
MDSVPRVGQTLSLASSDLVNQIASLVESTAALQKSTAQLLSQLPPHLVVGGPAKLTRPFSSHIDLTTPQSALPSTLAHGVPIPSRGWQQDHSPKKKIISETKARLMQDGWDDSEDTDMHAARLSEAMLRLGMEDIDNFTTEVIRILSNFLPNTYYGDRRLD